MMVGSFGVGGRARRGQSGATLAEFVSGVLRADDATIDAEIDNYL